MLIIKTITEKNDVQGLLTAFLYYPFNIDLIKYLKLQPIEISIFPELQIIKSYELKEYSFIEQKINQEFKKCITEEEKKQFKNVLYEAIKIPTLAILNLRKLGFIDIPRNLIITPWEIEEASKEAANFVCSVHNILDINLFNNTNLQYLTDLFISKLNSFGKDTTTKEVYPNERSKDLANKLLLISKDGSKKLKTYKMLINFTTTLAANALTIKQEFQAKISYTECLEISAEIKKLTEEIALKEAALLSRDNKNSRISALTNFLSELPVAALISSLNLSPQLTREEAFHELTIRTAPLIVDGLIVSKNRLKELTKKLEIEKKKLNEIKNLFTLNPKYKILMEEIKTTEIRKESLRKDLHNLIKELQQILKIEGGLQTTRKSTLKINESTRINADN